MTIPDGTSVQSSSSGDASVTVPGTASHDGQAEEQLTFVDWLAGIPKVYDLLAVAVAAAVGLLAPERLLPVPIADYKFVPSLVVIIAFVLTWAWRVEIRRHFKTVVTTTLCCALIVFALNLKYVRAVDYEGPTPETISYLIGETVSDPELCGTNYEIIIRQCGGDWAALSQVWGTSFYMVAVIYMLSYVLFVVGLVLSIGATGLAQARARLDENQPTAGGAAG